MIKARRGSGGLLLAFGVLSLATVITGAWISAAHGVPASLCLRNLAAWAVGLIAAATIARTSGDLTAPIALAAAPLALLATLPGPDQQGVHRWIDLGPAHLNAALVVLPAAAVAVGVLARERRWAWPVLLLTLALLVLQPDASQATALAGVAVLVAAATLSRPSVRIGLITLVILLAVLSWLRPDPLQPVPEVEQIIGLAFSRSPVLAAAAVLLLMAVAVTPVLATRSGPPSARLAGLCLGLYFLLWAIMPAFGAFPVPLVGIGMSPIIGAWLGAGVLAGRLAGPRPQA